VCCGDEGETMPRKTRSIPKTLKELAIAEYIRDYFGVNSAFPSNEEIVDHLKAEFTEEDVGPLYPKDITNLKKGAYHLLDISVALPRSGSLEVELREALNLDGVVVVGNPYRSYDAQVLRNIIGYQAARFFDEHVSDGSSVTFSCSMTIREMVKRIHGRYSKLSVYTDSVVAVDQFHVMSPASIAVLFLDRFPDCQATAYTLSPSIVRAMGREAVQAMLDKALFEKAFRASWVFVGIGTLTPELGRTGITPGFEFLTHVVTRDAAALAERGAVGEISYWPIDAQGNPIFRDREETLPYFRHVFTYSNFQILDRHHRTGQDHEKRSSRVVAAAGGPHKVAAIRAASKYIDYLVTDTKTAEALLR
jgi:DNA-binding transcriptional regulator LsrR (DeoR family)